jgi:hypothetical protein
VINAVSTEVATTDHPVIYKTEQPQCTADEWAQIINNAWQKSVETILETGCRIIEAKDDLEHGAFEQMVQTKLSFGPSTARKLMTIARHPVLSNRSHVNVLPASWGTLYALATKLPAELLEAKIADGTITPEIERKDVALLRNGSAAHGKPRPEQVDAPEPATPKPGNAELVRELEIAPSPEFAPVDPEKVRRLEIENAALQSEVGELRAERVKLQDENAALRTEIATLQNALALPNEASTNKTNMLEAKPKLNRPPGSKNKSRAKTTA